MAVVALISSLSLVASADSPPAKVACRCESRYFYSAVAKVHLNPLRKVLTLLLLKPNMKALSADFQAMAKEAETKRLTWSQEELKSIKRR